MPVPETQPLGMNKCNSWEIVWIIYTGCIAHLQTTFWQLVFISREKSRMRTCYLNGKLWSSDSELGLIRIYHYRPIEMKHTSDSVGSDKRRLITQINTSNYRPLIVFPCMLNETNGISAHRSNKHCLFTEWLEPTSEVFTKERFSFCQKNHAASSVKYLRESNFDSWIKSKLAFCHCRTQSPKVEYNGSYSCQKMRLF